MPHNKLPDNINYSGFFLASVNGSNNLLDETGVREVSQFESILSPAIHTDILIQSTIHNQPNKNYDEFKGAVLTVEMYNPNILSGKVFSFQQLIYRMEMRKPVNNDLENFSLLSCDPTLLNNAQRRMSGTYTCQSPSQVATAALSCDGATKVFVQPSQPNRDYQASNIHPFQVIAEQADVALDGGDPSFLHYMTFLDNGTHFFRSVKNMTQETSKWQFAYSEEGANALLGNPHNIIAYEFPCDFDLLTDMMNGVLPDGSTSASTIAINPFTGTMSLINGDITACGGLGNNLVNSVVTDTGSTDSCGTVPEDYMSLRQARLSLIQPDKIALKITVPYNPTIHAGDMIDVSFFNKLDGSLDYASGDYLIVNLTNSIKAGGYGITVLECVSKSVGGGVV